MSLPNAALVPPGIAPAEIVGPRPVPGLPGSAVPASRFGDVLASRAGAVQFSKHALQRVERRNIDVSPATLARLDGGVNRAAAKGSRDAVVLVDRTAFVVSVANRTVITAVGADQMKDQVFTNIDSAVIA